MNWLHFLMWIAGIYLVYYLVNILIDVAGGAGAPADKHLSTELTFSETVQPKRLEQEPQADIPKTGSRETGINKKPEPAIIASGGVSIKDLFHLVRQESILYTRPVSY
jgi:hypothetical protein